MTTATRRLRRASVAGFATIATVGGLVLATGGAASAAFDVANGVFQYNHLGAAVADTATVGGALDPTLMYPGKTAQAGAPLEFALPNVFSGGDQLTFTIQNNGKIAALAQNCSAANNVVSFAAAPAVVLGNNNILHSTNISSVGAFTDVAGSTTDTTPTFTVALATSSSCVAQAGVKDEFTVTFTNHSTGAAGDFYNFQISGLSYNVTAQATPGQVSLDVLAGNANSGGPGYAVSPVFANPDLPSTAYPPTTAGTLPRTPANNSAIIDAYISPLQFNIAAPNKIQPDGTKQTIGDITLVETLAGQFNQAGEATDTYTLTFSSGVTLDTVAPAPTVTLTGGASGEKATFVSTALNVLTFTVTGGTSTSGPATVTIHGIRLAASAPVSVGATLNGGILSENGAAEPATINLGGTRAGFPLPLAPVGLPASLSVNAATARIGGADRFETAGKLFQATVGTCSILPGAANRNVVLVSGANYPDALSANYLAGALKTGILLTSPTSVPDNTLNALRTEGVTTVYIVGGTAAVGANIQTQLMATPQYNCDGTVVNSGATAAKLNVVRIAGPDRYVTGQLVDQFTADLSSATSRFTSNSDLLSYTFGTAALHTAFVASGANYPDALAGGPSVYNGFPLVLTDPNGLTAASAATLTGLGIQQVIILGGTSAVSAAVETQLKALNGGTVQTIRFAGTDRTDTARILAMFELTLFPASSAGTGGLEFEGDPATNTVIYLANGNNYPDALAGGPLAGIGEHPLVLSGDATNVGTGAPAFASWVANLSGAANTPSSGSVGEVVALGLTAAVSTTVLNAVATAAAG